MTSTGFRKQPMPARLVDAPMLRNADDHRSNLTEEQRRQRMETAVHEAAHFVLACRVREYPGNAFVRVPGIYAAKAPFSTGGQLGFVAVGGNLIQRALISFAGVIAHQALADDQHRRYADDMRSFKDWAVQQAIPDELAYAAMEAVKNEVCRSWQVIDAVGACVLHCADRSGYLSFTPTSALVQLVERSPLRFGRDVEFLNPPSDEGDARPCIRLTDDLSLVEIAYDVAHSRAGLERLLAGCR